MEFASLFSGSDNLFKYIFTAGVVLILVSLVYPLQKKQEIELQINSYNKDVEVLNKNIANIKKFISQANQDSKFVLDSLTKLKALKDKNVDKGTHAKLSGIIKSIKEKYNLAYKELEKQQSEIEVSAIIYKHERKKIELLESHVKTYESYFNWFLWVGILSTIIGLAFWTRSTTKKEKLLTLEVAEKENKRLQTIRTDKIEEDPKTPA